MGAEKASYQPTRADRLWAIVAHLTVIIYLIPLVMVGFTSGSGVTAASAGVLAVYLVSPVIAALMYVNASKQGNLWRKVQALQALLFQTIAAIVGIISTVAERGSRLESLQLLVLIGCLYGVWAAVDITMGRNFRYIFLGKWVQNLLGWKDEGAPQKR